MDHITHLLTQGIDTIYPSKEALEKKLRSGETLTIYQGFDPSGAHLHIGHAVGLRKLRQFQKLGHKIIFLIGDFTGMIGDPSGKKDARRPLTREEVLDNAKDYRRQASTILDFEGENPVQIKFNSEWNSKLGFDDVIRLAGNFTVQQLLERDMYQTRMKEGREINLTEFFYPIIQGYDSAALNVDIEIGGTDQTFNMLIGRTLVSRLNNKEKFVITVPLLTDSKGVKIGKSEGNVIGITDPPNEFYAKIMTLGDDAIVNCFQLLTDVSHEEIQSITKRIQAGENPMTFKKQLAHTLTKQFHSEDAADNAQAAFEKTVQNGELPEDISVFPVTRKTWVVLDLLMQSKLITSRSEGRRLIEQKAVEINGTTIEPGTHELMVQQGTIVRVGKRKYIKIEIS